MLPRYGLWTPSLHDINILLSRVIILLQKRDGAIKWRGEAPRSDSGAHPTTDVEAYMSRISFPFRALMFQPNPVSLRLLRAGFLASVLLLVSGLSSPGELVGQGRGAAAGPGGGGFGGPNQERIALVEEFDADGDGVLNAAERERARAALATRGGGGRGGMPGIGGGGGGRGGMGGGTAPASRGVALTPSQVASFPGTDLYDLKTLRTIFIDFEDAAGWEDELAAFYNTDVQIPVRATVDGVVYEDVGVRFRGNSSFSMVPAGSKRPIRLKFDFVDGDQALEGYRTLNLLNANNDATFLRTILFSEIAREYIPAPKVGYVRLVINGENWGIYQNQQQFNNDFLEDFFGERGGARWQVPGSPNGRGGMVYLGEGIDQYRSIYEIDSRDDAESWNSLIRMFRVLNETPLERLAAELEPILDIDEVLRFLALDVVLANSDGYWTRASDYSIHQGLDGRFRIFPHDMNEGLGAGGGGGGGRGGAGGGGFPGAPGGGGGGGNTSLDPLVGLNDAGKPLRSRLLAVPELRERYLGYVRQIAENNLDWAVLGPRVAELRSLIEEDVRRDTKKLYTTEAFEAGFETGANSLKGFADARRSYLLATTAEAAR